MRSERRLVWLAALAIAGGCGGGGDSSSGGGGDAASDVLAAGKELYTSKGCIACHSLDGSARVGPTWLGIMGKEEVVLVGGEEKTIIVDDAYLKKSIMEPNAEIVKGFIPGQMPPVPITEAETDSLVALIKSLKPLEAEVLLPQLGQEIVLNRGCIGCHSLDGSARVGPSFLGLYGKDETVVTDGSKRTVTIDEDYIRRSIKDPTADTVEGYTQGLMPHLALEDGEIDGVIELIKALAEGKPKLDARGLPIMGSEGGPPPITDDEMAMASDIFFNRCGGCHGMLRKGATGPALTPEARTLALGTEGLKTFINFGSPKGMPAWGKQGLLTEKEVDLLARFLQHQPPPPPEMSMEQMKSSWKVLIPPEDRPTEPEHQRDWENFFGVVLRDAGKVAIFDGDTKELVNIVNTGFAVHILRSNATGRYFTSIGRDGKVTLIDLWMTKPDKVAEVKVCYEARSVESSKYNGPKGDFRDKYLVVGGYWPPSFVVMDGLTLEPLKSVSTSSYSYDTNEFLRESRVAAIVASHHEPEWVLNIKESGHMWVVDYTDIDNMSIVTIPCERFLHDGGWDATKRYVLMAANARDTIAVVDAKTKKRVALTKVGTTPHPGRGANIDHSTLGPIWCTGHLGDNTIACLGADPEGHPDTAWKVVKSIELPGDGGGNLFIKTHPNSKWLWADRVLHPDLFRMLYVIDKETLEVVKSIEIPAKYPGRAVHMEYNKAGDEVWVSAWSPQGETSGVLIYDDKTLELKQEITGDWLITPTGHFNVYNTVHDVY